MRLMFAVLISVFVARCSCGGVKMGMELEHRQVVQYEPVVVFLTLENDSGVPLVIDDYAPHDQNRMEFDIKRYNRNRDEVAFRGGRPIREAMLMPDDRREFMIDLSEFYELAEPGRYFVTPRLVWNGLTYTGTTIVLDVVPGFVIKNVRRAIPGYQDQHRDYKLLYLAREGHEQLFVRVDEVESNYTFGVVPIGNVVRVHQPQMTVDRNGKVEVLHQSSPGSYMKTTLISNRDSVEIEDQIQLVDGATEANSRALVRGLSEMTPPSDVTGEGQTGDQTEKE